MGKVNWDEETTRKLLTILLDEKESGRNKTNWESIAKNLNARTNGDATGKQIQNHASVMKMQFKTYEQLSKLSGISFDSETKKLHVAELATDRWKAYLKVFGGTMAQGIGGCFSPAMAKSSSYLSKHIEHLDINEEEQECEWDTDDSDVGIDLNLSSGAAESVSSPKSRPPKDSTSSRKKQKSEDTIESSELIRRQTSFDTVIQLLSNSVGSLSGVFKSQLVSDALTKMEVAEKKGDRFFMKAAKFLSEEKRADCFLSLQNYNQKWIYLDKIDEI